MLREFIALVLSKIFDRGSIVHYHFTFAFTSSLYANEFDFYDNSLQGHKKPIHKVKHSKSSYWTSILKKDDKVCGLLSLLQTGAFEIRLKF